MVEIAGNTYPVRDQLRALGGKWDAARKVWMVPADKADEARKLVEAAPRGKATGTKTRGHTYSPRVCKDCGCRINYGVYCGKCEYR
jgi:hypothetical protein